MRIQEKLVATATCAKMTEERSVNGNGPNGGSEVPSVAAVGVGVGKRSVKSHSPADTEGSHAYSGGRLKFYKDGKSILELSYRKDGDRMCWVSNWPVPGAAPGAARHESSASLSVSDDNSSVQSSPWQRDHCWKQASPRRGRGAHLQFLMRPLNAARRLRRLSFISRSIRRKRRRPYDSAEMNTPLIKEEEDESLNSSLNSSMNSSRSTPSKGKLPSIVQTLLDRVRTNDTRPVNPGGRIDPNIISPRKRILREMERVSLEEGANSKRQRARISQGNGASSNNSTVHCQTLHPAGVPPPVKTAASSYSITSLLAPSREEEPAISKETEPSFLRNLLKSPSSQGSTAEHLPDSNSKSRSSSKSGSGRKMSPTQHQPAASPAPSPSPGLRSPAVPSAVGGAAHYAPYMPSPLLYTPYMTPHHASHPYYSSLPLPHSSGPPLLVPYYLSSLPRAALYQGLVPQYHTPLSPSPWAQLSHQPHLDDLKKDDGSSDMPLNLSKHAG